ncbi:ATP-dependent DNA helicase RecG [Oscillospiraceae bacterium MB08-C2-2]|nr:ATP-dependent DNA helicase RecG [Oscillospiraceae bacterium MB08-C2-2]
MPPLTTQTPVQYLKGVGERRAALYHKLGIHTAGELLAHYPRSYLDLTKLLTIEEAPLGELCAIVATITHKSGEQRIRAGFSLFKLTAEDSTGRITITLFNNKFLAEGLRLEGEYIFLGKPGGSFVKKELLSPEVYSLSEGGKLLPVYPQTAGLNSRFIRKNISQILEQISDFPDILPPDIRRRYQLGEINYCLRNIHFPENEHAASVARKRFIFEELLVLSLRLGKLCWDNQISPVEPMKPYSLEKFYEGLPFSPTGAQRRSGEEIAADLRSGIPMNRLLQGDVGSGKTLVAAAAVWYTFQNGGQSAMMAPTEILASQHWATMTRLLEGSGIQVALLTGSTKASQKKAILAGMAEGSIHLCVGTHALLSQGVEFQNLRLVITDEQHRFGVNQRTQLAGKSQQPHVLVMSATPIPRTLSLMIYGDLKLSVLDELPPGRQPVETFVIDSSKRERALRFIKKHLDSGRQAYIVCPLIEQGEVDTGLRPAVEYAKSLSEGIFKGYTVGLLHGKMKPADKEKAMSAFEKGQLQLLVSTTVVEVGVDVPNAAIILIENAERFGLSQLHQLRGRVGRGKHQSFCILCSDAKGETSRKRLGVMKEHSDGFVIAEYDLKLRGPGDFFGSRQHGLPELHIASLADDMELLSQAQTCAITLLEQDPGLALKEHAGLAQSVQRLLERVGQQPN